MSGTFLTVEQHMQVVDQLRAENERLWKIVDAQMELETENERLRDALKEICNMNSGEGRDSCLMQDVAHEALGGYEAE